MAEIQSTTDRLIAQARQSRAASDDALLAAPTELTMRQAGTPLGLVSSGSDLLLQAFQSPEKRAVAQANENKLAAKFKEQQDYTRGQADKNFNYQAKQDTFNNSIVTNQDNRAQRNQDQNFSNDKFNQGITLAEQARLNRESGSRLANDAQNRTLTGFSIRAAQEEETERKLNKDLKQEASKLSLSIRSQNKDALDKLQESAKKSNIPLTSTGEIDNTFTEEFFKSEAAKQGVDVSTQEGATQFAEKLGADLNNKYSQEAKAIGLFDTFRASAISNQETQDKLFDLQVKSGGRFTDDDVASTLDNEKKYQTRLNSLPDEVAANVSAKTEAYEAEQRIQMGTVQKTLDNLISTSDALGQELIGMAGKTDDELSQELNNVVSKSLSGISDLSADNLEELRSDIDGIKVKDATTGKSRPLTALEKISFAKRAVIDGSFAFWDSSYNNQSNLADSVAGTGSSNGRQRNKGTKVDAQKSMQEYFDSNPDISRYTANLAQVEDLQRSLLKMQKNIDTYKTRETTIAVTQYGRSAPERLKN